MKINLYILTIIWLLLPASGGQVVYSQDEAVLELRNAIDMDICGPYYKKEIQIELRLGDVSISDSLYGFECILKFDNEKISYDNILVDYTLFKNASFKFGSSSNDTIFASVLLDPYSSPVHGDKALMVIKCNYIDECPDTSIVEVITFEPVEGYTRDVNTNTNLEILAKIKDDEERYLNLIMQKDTLDEFNEDSLSSVDLRFEANNEFIGSLDYVEFDLVIDENYINQFSIKDVIEIENGILESVTEIENGVRVRVSNISANLIDKDILSIKVKELKKEDNVSMMRLENIKAGECSCYTRLNGSSTFIKSISPEDTTGVKELYVNDLKDINVIQIDDETYRIKDNRNRVIEKVAIFDINGTIKRMVNNGNPGSELNISLSGLNRGVYPAIIYLDRNDMKKIMLIKL